LAKLHPERKKKKKKKKKGYYCLEPDVNRNFKWGIPAQPKKFIPPKETLGGSTKVFFF
jgi:hypothetical protein